MTKHSIVSATIGLVTCLILAAGAAVAGLVAAGISSSGAQARTVCTLNGYIRRCTEVEPPIAPKPGPQGQKTK